MNPRAFTIDPAGSDRDLQDAIALIRAYAAALPIDLAYQDFEAEMAAMPGKYAPPAGALLLARAPDGGALGCVGLRPMADPGDCEMKRLYVAPVGRGLGVGRALVTAVVATARQAGRRLFGAGRLDDGVIALVKAFVAARKPIAAVCHGAQVLAAADVIRDRTISAYPACAPEVRLAGGKYADIAISGAITDDIFVTAPAWPAHPAWMAQFLALLGTKISHA